MSTPPESFTVGSLYIAGFVQAQAPHVGLILPTTPKSAHLVHIRIDRNLSPHWMSQTRTEPLMNNMFLSTLLKIHDIADGPIALAQLEEAASAVPVPANDAFGECAPWIWRVVEELDRVGLVKVKAGGVEQVRKEFEAFVERNKTYARRDRFPNVMVSQWCS